MKRDELIAWQGCVLEKNAMVESILVQRERERERERIAMRKYKGLLSLATIAYLPTGAL